VELKNQVGSSRKNAIHLFHAGKVVRSDLIRAPATSEPPRSNKQHTDQGAVNSVSCQQLTVMWK
jgi:hypothetical protein